VSARSSERTKPPGPVRLGPQCVAPLAAVSAWWVASTVRRHRAHSAYFCPLRGAGKRRSVLPTSPVRPASSDGPSPFSKAVTHAGVPAVSLCLPHTSAVQAVVSAKAGRRSVCSPTTQATCLGSRGEATRYERPTATGGAFETFFCPICGSTVYARAGKHPTMVGVAVGAIRDPKYPAPTRSVWEEGKHDWIVIPEPVDHYPRGRS
jgi:hypothetical protein